MTHDYRQAPRVLDDVHVTIVSPEDAAHDVAELWSAGERIGFTCIEDGELALRIQPHAAALLVGVGGLIDALAEAKRRFAPYAPSPNPFGAVGTHEQSP